MLRFCKKIFEKPKTDTPFGKRSYSQCGEDLIISYLFSLRGINTPTYIDIGAHDPYYLSNTALFYERGARGINIEANPLLIDNFNRERPNDINLNIGISDTIDTIDFFIMEDSTLSTFSKSESDKMISLGKPLREKRTISTTTVSEIINTYHNGISPDFMSLDIEGLDYTILKDIDFQKITPKVICVEAADYSPIGAGKRRDDIIDLLIQKGYYEYANTNLNAIMVKRDFWFI
ncbi:MAG: FkbM family methyltransferase [Dysgonomonas sp.]|jgi:FkbM family methyltransferase|uniref:FkbM family methyltransferase n=1 Tax=Dysgonomonas sp. TaxID=1891233 RepID=UPI003A86523F